MGRQALILMMGFAIIAGVMKFRIERSERSAGRMGSERYEACAARNAAHSAAQMALHQLRQNHSWRAGYSNLNLAGSTVNVSIQDALSDSTLGQDTLRLTAQSSNGDEEATVIMRVSVGHPSFPGSINAGITARAHIGTLGNMLVDGRDHDLNGNLIPNSGGNAITTTRTYICGGSTALCGTTDAGVDLGPIRNNYDAIVDEGVSWPDFPDTPEKVLGGAAAGLPPNALKLAAMFGISGSQYTTDPATLTYPLRGITYVELPNGGEWNVVDFGPDSRGILVVHNSASDALVSNLNSGIFRGLIIADDMRHIHSIIIGGVFLLTETPRDGTCIGNGSGSLLYSRNVIQQGMEDIHMGWANVDIVDCFE
ncbi:MAG: hypothetical protein C4534_00490 [Gaiellales bacterium]|nr:MAG: hypothetical protein C4534_00490 [Gaiellales bacterium]